MTDKEFKLQSELWYSAARSLAIVIPSLDFVGWHGEHLVVVRGEAALHTHAPQSDALMALDDKFAVELKELPARRRLDSGTGVDLGSEDGAWLERKDVPIDYETPGLEHL